MTIWKYVFTDNEDSFQIPCGAEILTVQTQNDGIGGLEQICLWALVDPEQPTETRTFYAHPTGGNLGSRKQKYIGTVQMFAGKLVWHVFEVLQVLQ